MPASHMFVAPEGSKKGVGRGGEQVVESLVRRSQNAQHPEFYTRTPKVLQVSFPHW